MRNLGGFESVATIYVPSNGLGLEWFAHSRSTSGPALNSVIKH